jgi:hypothetical protein
MNRQIDRLVGLLSGSLGLCGLLLVAPNHDHAKEGANNSGTEEDNNDGNANGPDAGREEVLKRVIVVDKGLKQLLAHDTSMNMGTQGS